MTLLDVSEWLRLAIVSCCIVVGAGLAWIEGRKETAAR